MKMVTFNEEEWQAVCAKMREGKTRNFALFARTMLLNGEVRHYDFVVMKAYVKELGRIAGNINQIAKRCNAANSIYKDDVAQLQQEIHKIKSNTQGKLVKYLRSLE